VLEDIQHHQAPVNAANNTWKELEQRFTAFCKELD